MTFKKLKRQVAYSAVAGALAGVGMVGSAQAVIVTPDGLGEVLIFPYYTVRNNQVTAFSLVNTTTAGKAVKVRFLEALNSQEVLDFNLYLSPNDVWAASITSTSDGAKVNVVDQSCTTPIIATALGGSGSEPFRNGLYSADPTSNHGLDRTREGYIEVIEMGTIVPTFVVVTGTTFATATNHVGGVLTAAKCGALTTSWAPGGILNASSAGSVTANSGGMSGTAHIISLNEGTDISYQPTVFTAFSTATTNHTPPQTLSPTLTGALPAVSAVFQPATGTVVTSGWANAVQNAADPVSATLMASAVDNEYITATDLAAGTDWVVTFPTKRFYVNGVTRFRPFTQLFTSTGSCDTVTPTVFGREEEMKTGTIDFSPSTTPTTSLCWEVNVIRFGTNANADVLKSTATSMAIANAQIFTNGWMRLAFPSTAVTMTGLDVAPANGVDDGLDAATAAAYAHQMYDDAALPVGAGGFRYAGLPTLGFAVVRYSAASSSALASYGASYNHNIERLITAAP